MGLRVSVYFLLIYTLLYLGADLLIRLLGLDLAQSTAAASAAGEQMEIALFLWVQVLLTPTIFVATIAFVHFVDRSPLIAVGLSRPRLREGDKALWAAVAAAALLGLWIAIVSWVIDFELTRPQPGEALGFGGLFLYAAAFLVTASLEECIFRGYIYSSLRERFSWVHAAGLSSLLFVLPHLGNPNSVAAGMLNTFLLGLVLAAFREMTGNLWAATVFHGAWNFMLGSVLSLPVSGYLVPRLFTVEMTGSEAWSGGGYGPEGSWPMAVVLTLALLTFARFLDQRRPSIEAEEG